MKRSFLIILVILTVESLSAQFSDSVHYYAGLSSTATYNQTVSNSNYLLNNALKLGARKKSVRYNVMNKWLYGRQDKKLTNNDFSSMLDMNLYKTLPHFYYWGLFSYVSSYSLKVRNQGQAGIGIAYNVIDREKAVLNISDGLIYEYSEIVLTDSSSEKYSTTRNSLRLQLKWEIGKVVTFNGNGFYQPSLQYGKDYIIRSDISISARIWKWVSVRGAFNYNEISRTRTRNMLMSYGVAFERYF